MTDKTTNPTFMFPQCCKLWVWKKTHRGICWGCILEDARKDPRFSYMKYMISFLDALKKRNKKISSDPNINLWRNQTYGTDNGQPCVKKWFKAAQRLDSKKSFRIPRPAKIFLNQWEIVHIYASPMRGVELPCTPGERPTHATGPKLFLYQWEITRICVAPMRGLEFTWWAWRETNPSRESLKCFSTNEKSPASASRQWEG